MRAAVRRVEEAGVEARGRAQALAGAQPPGEQGQGARHLADRPGVRRPERRRQRGVDRNGAIAPEQQGAADADPVTGLAGRDLDEIVRGHPLDQGTDLAG